MTIFYDRVKFSTSTTGTGTITVGSASTGFRTPAQASIPNGTVLEYVIEDPPGSANWETGYGTYTVSGTTVSRNVRQSSNSDALLNLSGSAVMRVTMLSRFANAIDPYGIHHRLVGSHADDDEFDTNTLGNYTQVTPSGNVNWVIGTSHVASCVFDSQSVGDACAILKAMTLADGEWFETLVHIAVPNGVNYAIAGLIISDGATAGSNAQALFFYLDSSADEYGLEMIKGTVTNLTTTTTVKNFHANLASGLRMKLKRVSSTNFIWEISTPDGGQFSAFGTTGQDPGFTPTHAGVFVTTFSGAHTAYASFDFIRHMA